MSHSKKLQPFEDALAKCTGEEDTLPEVPDGVKPICVNFLDNGLNGCAAVPMVE